ncbi:ParA family protein [Testudinibacter sp. TR-2022]|uniref:ParA family protein n=1 Tax=Testudinibacter sp. TR-2022 TaxID=2585029 RepID=UPI0011198619|nr:ParA family protein [Testudinibacter sp. TR-2022]TNH04058.1 ParA family protein [Pasteurellaceae bacterium Phil31]TNH10157.1 ParA family protein [Testudinibacter sp. TR-2022]TNH13017.1 ParA family protein [Testudinibacter sp. TR-2022]
MKVISFLNPKGGAGKTTAVINIATCLVKSGYKIAVVDTDPQRSISNWNQQDKAIFDLYTAENEKDVYQVRKQLTGYDYVVIDGAGSLSIITAAAIMVSDLVIIPVASSPLDFSSSGSVLSVLEAQAYNRQVPAYYLITQSKNHANMLKIIKNNIAHTGIPRLINSLSYYEGFKTSLIDNGTIFDTKNGKAIAIVQLLTSEIITLLKTEGNDETSI